MKNIVSILFIFIQCSLLTAQVDRSEAPEPGPAPAINISDYESFTLDNGLQVFVVENHKIPRVSYSLSLDIKPVLEGNKKGYVNLAGQLIGTGTHDKTKAEIDEAIDYIGASVSTSASSIHASALKKHNDELLSIMSEILLEAEFRQEEFDKVIQQQKSDLALTKNDPQGLSDRVQKPILYGPDHPYGELITEKSLDNISLDDCWEYFSTYFKPNKAYLAIVGDITLEEAKEQVNRFFGKWEKGKVPAQAFKSPEQPDQKQVIIVDRPESVQSMIKIMYPISFRPDHDDFIPAKMTNTLLGGGIFRLFKNLRETHGYTYGSYSTLADNQEIGRFVAFANVRNEVTDSSVHEMLYEMERLRDETVPADELDLVKKYLTGNFALSLENPQTIARFAIQTAKYNLPDDFYANYLQRLNAVSAEDMQAAARHYILPEQSYIFVVGNKEEIAEKLKRFDSDNTITYYDENGNLIDPDDMAAPTDIDAETVIEKYIEAIGGEGQLQEIESIKTTMYMEMQGRKMNMTMFRQKPNKFNFTMQMNDQVVSQQIFDGQDGITMSMGQKQAIEGKRLDQMQYESYLFPELTLLNDDDFEYRITKVEKVDDQKAYVIEVKLNGKTISTDYYDMESGLKVKNTGSIETPQGTMQQVTKFSNYQEVDGVQFPFLMNQSMGPRNFDITVDNIEINADIDDQVFKIED